MRKKYFILFLLIVLLFKSYTKAQSIVVGPIMEKSIIGNQYGAAIGVKISNNLTIGSFYLSRMPANPEGIDTNTLFGLSLDYRIYHAEKLELSLVVRSGFANENFFFLVPGIETRFTIAKFLSLGGMMSLRYGLPSISGKIIFNIN